MDAVDAAHDAIHAAGWSAGDCAVIMPGRLAWLVTCTAGQQLLQVSAPTQAEAWTEAARQAHDLQPPR
jgi:hypothetical protein